MMILARHDGGAQAGHTGPTLRVAGNDRITPPPLEEQVPLFLNRQQYCASVRVARSAGIRCEIIVMLTTGLRGDELRQLEWSDVDLRRGGLQVREGKSSRPRTARLNRAATSALLRQRALTGDCRYVFPGRSKDRMRSVSWWSRDALAPVRAAVGSRIARNSVPRYMPYDSDIEKV